VPAGLSQPGVHHPWELRARVHAACARTVPEFDVFNPLGLALSEKQIPQIDDIAKSASQRPE
jgi:hypothetical protein